MIFARALVAHRGPTEPAAAEPELRVLVVGAGLTGVLAAARLRARADAAGRPLRLTVWERATYPSGRFGATATHAAALADLGSQVLSTVDPHDERAQPGHGMPFFWLTWLGKRPERKLDLVGEQYLNV